VWCASALWQRRKEREVQLAEEEEQNRINDPEYIKEQEKQAKQARILDLMRPKGKGENREPVAW
jgi:hypothetical protein